MRPFESCPKREGSLRSTTIIRSGGDLDGFRECHIAGDWILVYMISGDSLILTLSRTGRHEDRQEPLLELPERIDDPQVGG